MHHFHERSAFPRVPPILHHHALALLLAGNFPMLSMPQSGLAGERRNLHRRHTQNLPSLRRIRRSGCNDGRNVAKGAIRACAIDGSFRHLHLHIRSKPNAYRFARTINNIVRPRA
jgi:hypothetical protein